VKADVKTSITADKITLRLDEDWTGVFKGWKGAFEYGNWKFHEICREFLNRAEKLKDVCDYRYARRTVINYNDDGYDNNYVEIYEPLKMDNPLHAYGTYFDLKHLPVENEITEEQIPQRTWYPASPTVICLWFTGMIVAPDFDWENTDWDKLYNDEISEYIPLSEEYDKTADLCEAEKDFLANGGIDCGDSEFDMPDNRTLEAKEYRYKNTPYSCTKAEIIELAQKLTHFYNALADNNKHVFETAKQEENYFPKIQMLFYSDNFDALEFCLDKKTKEFKWSYYDN
jgi:hypothetical protein